MDFQDSDEEASECGVEIPFSLMNFDVLDDDFDSDAVLEAMSDDSDLSLDVEIQNFEDCMGNLYWDVGKRILPARVRSFKATYNNEERRQSVFYQDYIAPVENGHFEMRDPTTAEGKMFRSRFRIPYIMFESIVHDIRQHGKFENADATGVVGVDLRLLVLGSLHTLANGSQFTFLEEVTRVHRETHRDFFKTHFLQWGIRAFRTTIKMPKTDEEVHHIMDNYASRSLPGCIGSIDCVHLHWDLCRSGLQSACKGKEKYPSLTFEVVCSHTRKILSVNGFYWGTVNDKTIAHHDPVLRLLKDGGGFLHDFEWQTRDRDGNIKHHTGLYFICDGGYHNWPCMMAPFKDQWDGTDLEKWSSLVESIRKDIECVFGILKRRFFLLKMPMKFGDPDIIAKIFYTCCVLHNMLLDCNGNDCWRNDANDGDNDIGGEDLNERTEEEEALEHEMRFNFAAQQQYRCQCLVDHFMYGLQHDLFDIADYLRE